MNTVRKNVLYVSRSYEPDSPIGQRFINFKNYLSSTCNLTVLNLSSKLFVLSKNNRFEIFINKCYRKLPLLPDSDILILPTYKRHIKKLLRTGEFNTVLIQILPFSFLKLAKWIRHIAPNINIIVDISDPMSININSDTFNNYVLKYFIKLENSNLKFVNSIIVLNNEIKDYYKSKLNAKVKIIVIEQGIDKYLTSINSKSIRNESVYKLIYAGALYKDKREPFELYKAIANHSLKLILYVFGGLNKYFLPPNTKDFVYCGHVSRLVLSEHYEKSDIIVFIDNKFSFQIPGKSLEILALNKPILFIYYNSNSPTLKYFNFHKGVYFCKNNCKSIIDGINRIIRDDNFIANRNLSNYFWENLLTRLNSII